MSSSSITSFPTISGGLPTSVDLGPSVLFIVLYCVLLPIGIWRMIQYRRPGRLLFAWFRLTVFVNIRIATFILRAMEARQTEEHGGDPTPAIGIFVGEQILLGAGFIVLIDVLADLVQYHLTRTDIGPPIVDKQAPKQSRLSLVSVLRIMHVALLVAVALAIFAGIDYESAISNPSKAGTVKTIRIVSTTICIVITLSNMLVSLWMLFFHTELPKKSSTLLVATSIVLVIVPAYRISTLESTETLADLLSSSTKAKFWVFQVLCEWITSLLFLSVDVRRWFGVEGSILPPSYSYDRNMEMGNRRRGYSASAS